MLTLSVKRLQLPDPRPSPAMFVQEITRVIGFNHLALDSLGREIAPVQFKGTGVSVYETSIGYRFNTQGWSYVVINITEYNVILRKETL